MNGTNGTNVSPAAVPAAVRPISTGVNGAKPVSDWQLLQYRDDSAMSVAPAPAPAPATPLEGADDETADG